MIFLLTHLSFSFPKNSTLRSVVIVPEVPLTSWCSHEILVPEKGKIVFLAQFVFLRRRDLKLKGRALFDLDLAVRNFKTSTYSNGTCRL